MFSSLKTSLVLTCTVLSPQTRWVAPTAYAFGLIDELVRDKADAMASEVREPKRALLTDCYSC